MNMQRSLYRVLLLTLLCCSAIVSAKNRLLSSDPADGAVLQIAPAAVRLQFDKKTRLTALALQLPDGKVIDLGLPKTQLLKMQYAVPLPLLTPGNYVLRWTGRGKDHWYFSGAQHFDVRPGLN